jgi:hypothetical protein
MVNEFAAPCVRCKAEVAPGEGYVLGKTGKVWEVEHKGCIAVADPTKYGRPAKLRSER